MIGLRALRRALAPKDLDAQAERLRALGARTKTLREDLRALRRTLDVLSARTDAAERQVARLRALRDDAPDLGARLDALAAALDAEHVAAHVREAVSRAAVLEQPVPHVAIRDLWPREAYEAIVDTIPGAVFFDGGGAVASILRVPPRLAPVDTIVAWTFVAQVVDQALVPAVAARLGPWLAAGPASVAASAPTASDVETAPGRLVRLEPGAAGAPAPLRGPGHLAIVFGRSGAEPPAGPERGAEPAPSGTGPGLPMPHRENTAVAFVGPASFVTAPPPPGAAPRHVYEVGFGLRRTDSGATDAAGDHEA